jgi:hypothetical protein
MEGMNRTTDGECWANGGGGGEVGERRLRQQTGWKGDLSSSWRQDVSHQLNRLALVELAAKLASNQAITGGAGVSEGQCEASHTIHAMRARGAL